MSRLHGDDAKAGTPPASFGSTGCGWSCRSCSPVREVPVTLTVNDVALATLIASPRDLHFLVAGFLRMQGLIRSRRDLLTLSVCHDFGSARSGFVGRWPKRFTPTLHLGCGAGSVSTCPTPRGGRSGPSAGPFVRPELFFPRWTPGAGVRRRYRGSGGIHSAGVWDGERLLTVRRGYRGGHNRSTGSRAGPPVGDRPFGEILVASGASPRRWREGGFPRGFRDRFAARRRPTWRSGSAAELGVTLVGYVRGRKFNVYPTRSGSPPRRRRGYRGVTGVDLAGGRWQPEWEATRRSLRTRAGVHRGDPRPVGRACSMRVIVVTREPAGTIFSVPPGEGPLHRDGCPRGSTRRCGTAARRRSSSSRATCRTCRRTSSGTNALSRKGRTWWFPRGRGGREPLHAVYRKRASFPSWKRPLRDGPVRVVSFFDGCGFARFPRGGEAIDPDRSAFRNINTRGILPVPGSRRALTARSRPSGLLIVPRSGRGAVEEGADPFAEIVRRPTARCLSLLPRAAPPALRQAPGCRTLSPGRTQGGPRRQKPVRQRFDLRREVGIGENL